MSSNIKDQMHNRNQGMLYALKIVKDGGIEALERKVEFYNITGISMLPAKKEDEYIIRKLSEHATEVAIAFALTTLMDEFSFSSYQLQKFKRVFDAKVFEVLSGGDVDQSMADQVDRISREAGIDILIPDVD
jgi:PBP1b-binding outer membrane lipoprotein LpoB